MPVSIGCDLGTKAAPVDGGGHIVVGSVEVATSWQTTEKPPHPTPEGHQRHRSQLAAHRTLSAAVPAALGRLSG